MLRLVILLALLGLAYAAYRWQRKRMLAQELAERERRHREQQEEWDRMLADMAHKRRAGADAPQRDQIRA